MVDVRRCLIVVGLVLCLAGILLAEHLIGADKGLACDWDAKLFERGQRHVYRGDELEAIGMPCGGICAGQVYVRGDGSLAHWWIANNAANTGWGSESTLEHPLGNYQQAYTTYRPFSPIEQGFAAIVKQRGKDTKVYELSRDGFDDIGFIGEYPVATIEYRKKDKAVLPVEIDCKVFSPFIPLNAKDSAIPVTVLNFTMKNVSDSDIEVGLAGWLQNAVCLGLKGKLQGQSRSTSISKDGLTGVYFDYVEPKEVVEKKVIVFEDFEGESFDENKWTVDGNSFIKPTWKPFDGQEIVTLFEGKNFVSSFENGDASTGKMVSVEFTIEEDYITFLIGGAEKPGQVGIRLIVDGKEVRNSTGSDKEYLTADKWDVKEFKGQKGHIEIFDDFTGSWGHINIDHICFSNMGYDSFGRLPQSHPQNGNMALTAMDEKAKVVADWESKEAFFASLTKGDIKTQIENCSYPIGEKKCGAVVSSVKLKAGQSKEMTFLVSWYFPNRCQKVYHSAAGQLVGVGDPVGNMYRNWFGSSLDVAEYVKDNYKKLVSDTFLFHDTYYNQTTLPRWFIGRIAMPISTLATETCQWWANGRFWAWEGVGACPGVCTHVWNYQQGLARLFPELERSVRQMQDFGCSLEKKTGLVGDRGQVEYKGEQWSLATDGQAGTILKAYREHLISEDKSFLVNNWAGIKLALDYLIREHDINGDGLIEVKQPNTFDRPFYGANTFVGSLYLAALRAGEEMAKVMGEEQYAENLHNIFESGSAKSVEKLWNGQYFIQDVDLKEHPQDQYAKGCLSDQIFGQGWAHQIGLGYIYPKDKVHKALESIWNYNWTSDVGAYNKVFPARRVFANDGEAGLLVCTWPISDKHEYPLIYSEEVWTGGEYQLAGQMIYEGMVKEGLTIIRGTDGRYNGVKHNPFDEVECGEHYARAMASWGCLIAAQGFIYDGPIGKIGFVPNIGADDFKAFFSAAKGWGSIEQKRENNLQINSIALKWGSLKCSEFFFEIPQGKEIKAVKVTSGNKVLSSRFNVVANEISIKLSEEVVLKAGGNLRARLSFK